MKKLIRAILLLLTAALLTGWQAVPAEAATKKKIRSVSIKVKNKLEAGSEFRSSDVIEGEPDSGELGVWVTSEKYEISSIKVTSGTTSHLKVGQTIRMKVILEVMDDDYIFRSGLGKSNVDVSSCAEVTNVSRSAKKLTVTISVSGVKGEYDAPEDAWWKDTGIGVAKWTKPYGSDSNGSGHYEVVLKKGGQVVTRLEDTTATSYDFYPYMTRSGSYTFRVRTIPHTGSQQKYGKTSDWTESEEYYLEADEIYTGTDYNGSAYDGGTAPVPEGIRPGEAGWYRDGEHWRYRYPDGTDMKNGWAVIQGRHYLFDMEGNMMTGWVQLPAGWYYLSASGEMLTGWQNINEVWYYFYEDPGAEFYGRMAENTLVQRNGATVYVDGQGHIITGWVRIGDHWSYFYPDGSMARNTVVETFYVDANGAWRP